MTTPNQGRLRRRAAVITGAAGGQGSAVARRFAAEGARVAITDSQESQLESLAHELRATGAEVLQLTADVREEAQVAQVVGAAADAFGQLDILYNNAGVYWPDRDAPVDQLDREVWDEIVAINTTGSFLFCKHAVRHMLEGDKADKVILNVASAAAYAGDKECHAYAASKGALIALTKSIAQRYGKRGLRANVICPGFIDTPMVSFLFNDDALTQRVLEATALGRVGDPDEVATVAAFLASEEATFVTSAVVAVHGGLVK